MKYLIFALILFLSTTVSLIILSQRKPNSLGITNGKLSQCPNKDNCVSSEADIAKYAIAPLHATGSVAREMAHLTKTIGLMDGSRIITVEGNYLHAEFSTPLLHFVDDLECFYEQDKGIINVRSASRVGYSDLGANQKRLEKLRTLFNSSHDSEQ